MWRWQFRTPFDHELLLTKEDKAGVGRQVVPKSPPSSRGSCLGPTVVPDTTADGAAQTKATKHVTLSALKRGTEGIPYLGDKSVLEYHEKLAFIHVRMSEVHVSLHVLPSHSASWTQIVVAEPFAGYQAWRERESEPDVVVAPVQDHDNDMSNGDFWSQFSLVDSVTLETEAGYSVCLKGLPTTARRLSILEKACPAPHADDFNVRTCALLGGTCALIHCRMHLP